MTVSNSFIKKIINKLDQDQLTNFLSWHGINIYFIVRTKGNGYMYFEECILPETEYKYFYSGNSKDLFGTPIKTKLSKRYELKIFNYSEKWNLNPDYNMNSDIKFNGNTLTRRMVELKANKIYLLPDIGNVRESILLTKLYEITTAEFSCRPSVSVK